MNTISNTTTAELINKVAEWAEMTDGNFHSEVLCDVAFFFELSNYVDFFFPYIMKSGLTLEESNARYDKANEMKEEIRTKYGENVWNLIKKGF